MAPPNAHGRYIAGQRNACPINSRYLTRSDMMELRRGGLGALILIFSARSALEAVLKINLRGLVVLFIL